MDTGIWKFAIKFIDADISSGGEITSNVSQTGDFTCAIVALIFAIVAVSSFTIFCFRLRGKNCHKSAISSSLSILKSNAIFLVISITSLLLLLFSFAWPWVNTAFASGNDSETIVVEAKVFDDGKIDIDPVNIKNTSSQIVKLKSSSFTIEKEVKEDLALLESTIKIKGLDGFVFEGHADGEPYISKDAYGRLEPQETTQLYFSIEGLDASTANSYINKVVYTNETLYENAVVAIPESSNYTYDGLFHTAVAQDPDHYQFIQEDNTTTDSVLYAQDVNRDSAYDEVQAYFSSIKLNNPGFIWEDGTQDIKTYEWYINPDSVTITTGSQRWDYNTEEHFCDTLPTHSQLHNRQISFDSEITKQEYLGFKNFTSITHVYECRDNSEVEIGKVNSVEVDAEVDLPSDDYINILPSNYNFVESFGKLYIDQVEYKSVSAPDQSFPYDTEKHGNHIQVVTFEDEKGIVDENVVVSVTYNTPQTLNTTVSGSPYQITNVVENTQVHYSITSNYKVNGANLIGDYLSDSDEDNLYKLEITPHAVGLDWYSTYEKTFDAFSWSEVKVSLTSGSIYPSDIEKGLKLKSNLYDNMDEPVEASPINAGSYKLKAENFIIDPPDASLDFLCENYSLPNEKTKTYTINPRPLNPSTDEIIFTLNGDSGTDSLVLNNWFKYNGSSFSPSWATQNPIRIFINGHQAGDYWYPSTEDFAIASVPQSLVNTYALSISAKNGTNFSGNIENIPWYIYQDTNVKFDSSIKNIVDSNGSHEDGVTGFHTRGGYETLTINHSDAISTPYTVELKCTYPDSSTENKYFDINDASSEPVQMPVPNKNGVYASGLEFKVVPFVTISFSDKTSESSHTAPYINRAKVMISTDASTWSDYDSLTVAARAKLIRNTESGFLEYLDESSHPLAYFNIVSTEAAYTFNGFASAEYACSSPIEFACTEVSNCHKVSLENTTLTEDYVDTITQKIGSDNFVLYDSSVSENVDWHYARAGENVQVKFKYDKVKDTTPYYFTLTASGIDLMIVVPDDAPSEGLIACFIMPSNDIELKYGPVEVAENVVIPEGLSLFTNNGDPILIDPTSHNANIPIGHPLIAKVNDSANFHGASLMISENDTAIPDDTSYFSEFLKDEDNIIANFKIEDTIATPYIKYVPYDQVIFSFKEFENVDVDVWLLADGIAEKSFTEIAGTDGYIYLPKYLKFVTNTDNTYLLEPVDNSRMAYYNEYGANKISFGICTNEIIDTSFATDYEFYDEQIIINQLDSSVPQIIQYGEAMSKLDITTYCELDSIEPYQYYDWDPKSWYSDCHFSKRILYNNPEDTVPEVLEKNGLRKIQYPVRTDSGYTECYVMDGVNVYQNDGTLLKENISCVFCWDYMGVQPSVESYEGIPLRRFVQYTVPFCWLCLDSLGKQARCLYPDEGAEDVDLSNYIVKCGEQPIDNQLIETGCVPETTITKAYTNDANVPVEFSIKSQNLLFQWQTVSYKIYVAQEEFNKFQAQGKLYCVISTESFYDPIYIKWVSDEPESYDNNNLKFNDSTSGYDDNNNDGNYLANILEFLKPYDFLKLFSK